MSLFADAFAGRVPPKTAYTAKIHTTGGRHDGSRGSGGRLDIKLSVACPATAQIRSGSSLPGSRPVSRRRCEVVALTTKTRLSADVSIEAEVDLDQYRRTIPTFSAPASTCAGRVDREVAQSILS